MNQVYLIAGNEEFLVQRRTEQLWHQFLERFAENEKTVVAPGEYEPGQLQFLASPSLFAEPRFIVIQDIQDAPDEFLSDYDAVVSALETEVLLVLTHTSAQKGKKLLEHLKKSAYLVKCDQLKKDTEKASFVTEEFRAKNRVISKSAVQALVQALGGSLRELAAGCEQLMADVSGKIDVAQVEEYYSGKDEITAFKVADTLVRGDKTEVLSQLRLAMLNGVDPVLLVGAFVHKLRGLAKAAAVRQNVISAKESGLAPWLLQNASADLRYFTPKGIEAGIKALAQADFEVKGGARDSNYAVEKAVLKICDHKQD